jgi:hypothetical protein
MNAMMMSALAAFGIAAGFGAVQSDPQKAMDEGCARRTESCCSPKPDNCCEKKMEGCCEKMKDECCMGTSVTDGKRTSKQHHGVKDPQSAGKVPTEAKPGGDAPCASKDDCNFSFTTDGKRTVRQSFCEHGGQRVACGEKVGECASCMK